MDKIFEKIESPTILLYCFENMMSYLRKAGLLYFRLQVWLPTPATARWARVPMTSRRRISLPNSGATFRRLPGPSSPVASEYISYLGKFSVFLIQRFFFSFQEYWFAAWFLSICT